MLHTPSVHTSNQSIPRSSASIATANAFFKMSALVAPPPPPPAPDRTEPLSTASLLATDRNGRGPRGWLDKPDSLDSPRLLNDPDSLDSPRLLKDPDGFADDSSAALLAGRPSSAPPDA